MITMSKVVVDNAVAMVEKEIKDSRIIGLKQWDGKKVILVIKE